MKDKSHFYEKSSGILINHRF